MIVKSIICTYMGVCCGCVLFSCYLVIFFFFKQKTAYEMRISDWSSDVCSSDLAAVGFRTERNQRLLPVVQGDCVFRRRIGARRIRRGAGTVDRKSVV